jgi:hypothetical protein
MYNIDTCAICRETLETSETRVLPCNHSYHKECIDSWLTRVPSCPYCRTIVVIEGVTPRPLPAVEDVIPRPLPAVEDVIPRPLPDDDIVPWIRASRSAGDITREEIERFMYVIRHNPSFNRFTIDRVIYNLCRFHNFDAHLLPDDDIMFWYCASRSGVVPEPVMDRFVRELRHNFDHRHVHLVLNNALIYQSGYSADLRQLIEQACQESTQ